MNCIFYLYSLCNCCQRTKNFSKSTSTTNLDMWDIPLSFSANIVYKMNHYYNDKKEN